MSGTGQNNQSAPTRLTPIVVDQPITDANTGRPTPYFAQAFQRILSYLGQPITSSTGSSIATGLTISEQIDTLNTQVQTIVATTGGVSPGQAGLASRIALIEQTVKNVLRFGPPPPQRSSMTPAFIMSWWR